MKFLKKSNAQVAVAPEQELEPVKVATASEDSMDQSIGVMIQINVKTSNDVIDNVAKEGITIKVNDKAISLDTSASVEESQRFVDDLQQAVSQDATTKKDDEEQQEQATKPSVLDQLMFWKATKTDKPAKEEKEETVVEESKPEEEEMVEKKEEVEPVAEADAPKEKTVEAEPATETESEVESLEESAEKKEEAEPAAEAEAPKEQEESSSPFSFLQNKLTFWQDEATKEQKEEEAVAEEVKSAEAQVDVEVEQKEVEEKAFSHEIELFVDGAAIQTIRLTNAGMVHLNNFIASVQEEARLKGEEVAVTQAWLAQKMSEFFESAKVQGDAVVSTADAEPVKEETTAEVETQPAAKRSWWPFGTARETTEEKVVDEARNETAEVEVKEDATEQTREVAEAA